MSPPFALKDGLEQRTVPLLARAADAGFEVLLTNDASIEHQQNFAEVQIVVVILDAPTNKLEDLLPLVPKTLEVVSRARAGEAHHLGKL